MVGRSLMREAFVHGEKEIELAGFGNQPEQLTVLDTCPTCAWYGLNVMTVQFPAQARRQTFIQ
jgi:hypothetical protein